jgi:hypothetical protein
VERRQATDERLFGLLLYHWQFNGIDLDGATNSDFATNVLALTCQGQHGGMNLPGATDASLSLVNVLSGGPFVKGPYGMIDMIASAALVFQSDQNLLAGGAFGSVQASAHSNLACFNPNRTGNATFTGAIKAPQKWRATERFNAENCLPVVFDYETAYSMRA